MAVQPPGLPKNEGPAAGQDLIDDMALAMKAYTPSLGTADPRVQRAAPNSPFWLRHWRGNWQVSTTFEKPMLLPEIGIFVLRPGVNGVRTRGKDEDENMTYRAAFRKETDDHGWNFLNPITPVPVDCLPKMPSGADWPEGGYIRCVDCIHPITGKKGTRYLEAWMKPVAGDDGSTDYEWDLATYEKWLLWLVESGQIDPPTQKHLDKITRTVGNHLKERLSRPYANPEIAKVMHDEKREILARAKKAKLPEKAAA